jgi:hypothetical protein
MACVVLFTGVGPARFGRIIPRPGPPRDEGCMMPAAPRRAAGDGVPRADVLLE